MSPQAFGVVAILKNGKLVLDGNLDTLKGDEKIVELGLQSGRHWFSPVPMLNRKAPKTAP